MIKYACNTHKYIVAKIEVLEITPEWVYFRNIIGDNIPNIAILKSPTNAMNEFMFDTYEEAAAMMGVFLYKNYDIATLLEPRKEIASAGYRFELDTEILKQWIELAKKLFPHKLL